MISKPPRGWHSRGYLPHFDGGDITQAITFRLADSLPHGILVNWRRELERETQRRTEDEINEEMRKRIEEWLDAGHGQCHLSDARVAEVVQNALLHFDNDRYRLWAWVVMPNHVHLILTPDQEHSLSQIMHSLKSYTALQVNKILETSGSFWQPDYFDRFIRDGRHFAAAIAYVENNPVKAGLCIRPEDWLFGSARFRLS